MAIKTPGPRPERAKDVDDVHADRFHGQTKEGEEPRAEQARAPVDQQIDNAYGPQGRAGPRIDEKDEEIRVQRKQDEEQKKKKRQAPSDGDEQKEPPPKPVTTAGHLAHDANYQRSRTAKDMGFDQSPDVGEFMSASTVEGDDVSPVLPSARVHGHPDLPEAEIRPPDFLKPLEAMKDIYMKSRGRMSRRTQELLEGVDLEDLLEMLRALFQDERLSKSSEARLIHSITALLKDDPGPLLLGLTDPRLSEPWRLFLDGWEIWVPEKEEDGVDLFWEGEAEDDDGEVIEMMQSLQFKNGELTLFAKLGDLEDRITFDGETFYRLRSDREAESAP